MSKVDVYTHYYEDPDGCFECTVFLNTDKIPVDIVFCNDGDWRNEYFNPALKSCGVIVKKLTKREASKEVEEAIESFVLKHS